MFQKEYFYVLYWLNSSGYQVNTSGIISVSLFTTASKAFNEVLDYNEAKIGVTPVITEFRRVR